MNQFGIVFRETQSLLYGLMIRGKQIWWTLVLWQVLTREELQKVHESDDIYKIGKILAEKKENSKVKVLVKRLWHNKTFNS